MGAPEGAELDPNQMSEILQMMMKEPGVRLPEQSTQSKQETEQKEEKKEKEK